MKIYLVGLTALVLIKNLIGAEHYDSLHLKINSLSKQESHFRLDHQTQFSTLDDNHFIFSASYKPSLSFNHQVEGLIGYRTFFSNVGYGLNLGYMSNNKPSIFVHQFSPGLELFYKIMQISLNHYIPLKGFIKEGKKQIAHHQYSELGMTIRPSKKIEFGILPHYNHDTHKWGMQSNISYNFKNGTELSLNPFCKEGCRGIVFSIGFHFGGPKDRKSQPIRKSNEFFYKLEKTIKLKKQFIPISNANDVPTLPMGTNPVEKKEILTDLPSENSVKGSPEKKPLTLWERFFGKKEPKEQGNQESNKSQFFTPPVDFSINTISNSYEYDFIPNTLPSRPESEIERPETPKTPPESPSLLLPGNSDRSAYYSPSLDNWVMLDRPQGNTEKD